MKAPKYLDSLWQPAGPELSPIPAYRELDLFDDLRNRFLDIGCFALPAMPILQSKIAEGAVVFAIKRDGVTLVYFLT